jgi:hypothetical protein
MKKKTSFFLFLLLLGLYIFLFPFPLSKETYLLPVWVKDVSHSETSPGDSQSSPIPFRLGDTFGFVSEKGALSLSEAVLYDVSFDENFSSGGGFVSFSSVSDNLVFRDRKGDFLFAIETFGYPILMNGRIFVISTDRQTLAEYDDTGAMLWRKSYTSIITAAHATSLGNSDPLIVVGLLNGRTEVLSRSGSLVFTAESEGSRIAVTYGCGISKDGQYIAISSGIDPRVLSVYERKGGQFKLLFSKTLGDTSRKFTGIRFADDSRSILVAGDGVFRIFDLKGTEVDRSFSGKLIEYGYGGERSLSYLLSSDSGEGEFSLFDPEGLLGKGRVGYPGTGYLDVVEKRFPAKVSAVTKRGNSFFLGIDTKLMRIDIQER